MSTNKSSKPLKLNEYLPSFLSSIPQKPKDMIIIGTRRNLKLPFTGPVFFGNCKQHHPDQQSNMDSSGPFLIPKSAPSKEEIWENLFIDEPEEKKCFPPPKPFRLVRPEKKKLVDHGLDRSRGVRVVAGHCLRCPIPDLGVTKSKIKAETIREILTSIPVDPALDPRRREAMQEHKRLQMEIHHRFLPPNQRSAHYHFPKEFVKVRVVGPRIPASLTIQGFPIEAEEEKEEPPPKEKTPKKQGAPVKKKEQEKKGEKEERSGEHKKEGSETELYSEEEAEMEEEESQEELVFGEQESFFGESYGEMECEFDEIDDGVWDKEYDEDLEDLDVRNFFQD